MNEKTVIGAIVAIALLVGAGSAVVLIENSSNPDFVEEEIPSLLSDSAVGSESGLGDSSNVAKFVAALVIGLSALLILRHGRE